jgi:hypothetical protein
MPLDRQKLVKVLQLSLSDNDAEALGAIRAANRMLRDAGVGWTGLISGARIRSDGPAPWVRPAPTMSIDEALEYLVANDSDEWLPLRREWERRRQMSPFDQRRMMDRVYEVRRQEDDQRDVPEGG